MSPNYSKDAPDKASDVTVQLNAWEHEMLSQLKEAHPPYFAAMMQAATVIIPRNRKYTGGHGVFANFELDAKIQGLPVGSIFKQWLAKKLARIMQSGADFEDESFVDSLNDLANYALLFAGYINHNGTE